MESIRLFMCALLLSPAVALAQAEEAVEEPAVEEVPVEEAPTEVTEESAPADEAAPAEEVSEEAPAEETAAAGGPIGGHQIDLFFVPRSVIDQQVGTSTADEDGDGYGLRGLFRIGRHFAVSGEYEGLKFGDNDELELKQTRAGLGFVGDDDSGGFFGLFAEYDVLDFGDFGDIDGYSLHGRLAGMPNEWLKFYGDLGYLRLQDDVEDYSGKELTVGVLFKIGQFGIFTDVRRTDLEGKDSGERVALTDFRTGVRFDFGEQAAE